MRYDFDKMTDRSNSLSYKWDVKDGELPMWVADMDFETAPEIKAALVERAEHGIFGYSTIPDEFFKAVSEYFGRMHGFRIPTDWMVYSSGVVAAISALVRKLTTPGENVLIQAPVYNTFYNSIVNNGRRVLSSDLVYRDGAYSVDYEDLEKKLSDPQTSLMILCNPHNPVGKLWTREELVRLAELCYMHGVTVISDEIHCDFVTPGLSYTPFASASELSAEISLTCVSGSKTFNIAGLQSACVYSKNPFLRHKAWRALNTDEVGEPNAFSMVANITAFNKCDEWVRELNEYIWENKHFAEEYIEKNIPALKVVYSQATYLLWVDVSGVSRDSASLAKKIRELTGLYVSSGVGYGECGGAFLRINLATQRERVKDGLSRLKRGIEEIFCNMENE